mmetsp:Transcript_117722/g.344842  ORF Transcript_117722/g.344842 Transcript_117722/m.344842 type:complete len:201 (-) Transcript_117722:2209-2811(-)
MTRTTGRRRAPPSFRQALRRTSCDGCPCAMTGLRCGPLRGSASGPTAEVLRGTIGRRPSLSSSPASCQSPGAQTRCLYTCRSGSAAPPWGAASPCASRLLCLTARCSSAVAQSPHRETQSLPPAGVRQITRRSKGRPPCSSASRATGPRAARCSRRTPRRSPKRAAPALTRTRLGQNQAKLRLTQAGPRPSSARTRCWEC